MKLVSKKMNYKNLKKKSIQDSPFQRYLEIFQLDITLDFNELYYINNVGWFISKEFLSHQLFFIELEKNQFTPTSFCYDFIKKNISNEQCLELISIKWTNEFLYSKDIPTQHAINSQELKKVEDLKYYLIEFNNSILGIGKCEKGKKFILNIENISKYLFEEK